MNTATCESAAVDAPVTVPCRSCGETGLLSFLDLGQTPLADGLVRPADIDRPADRYPLEVAFCPRCALVQILETVPPEVLFCQDYPYYSSFSESWLKHARKNAHDLIERRQLNGNSFVVELASNDGYLLKNFVEQGIPCLGIDPADGPVRAAIEAGVPSLCDFFTRELALELRDSRGPADVVIANNVLAHVADTNAFVEGMRMLIEPKGILVIEVPYVRDLVNHGEFDTIYHQHLCYFSVTSLDHLFRRHGLFLNDVQRLASHGGSLRLFVECVEAPSSQVVELLAQEQREGVNQLSHFENFSHRVRQVLGDLTTLVHQLRADGARIAGYAAAAKACTLLNCAGLDHTMIDYIVDRNVHKQGQYMPGVNIPILPTEHLASDLPDYCLLLAWNLAKEIIPQQREYLARGGRFIVPLPEVRIIDATTLEDYLS